VTCSAATSTRTPRLDRPNPLQTAPARTEAPAMATIAAILNPPLIVGGIRRTLASQADWMLSEEETLGRCWMLKGPECSSFPIVRLSLRRQPSASGWQATRRRRPRSLNRPRRCAAPGPSADLVGGAPCKAKISSSPRGQDSSSPRCTDLGELLPPRPVRGRRSRYTLSHVLRANRLLIWAAVWVAFGIYWLAQGFWIFTIALLAAAGLLVWQDQRDRRVSRPPLS
jgi:hypothetical protein